MAVLELSQRSEYEVGERGLVLSRRILPHVRKSQIAMMSLPYSRKNKLLEVTSPLVSLLCQKLFMIIVKYNGLAAMYSIIPRLIYKETVLSMLSCLPSPVPRRMSCFWKRNEEKCYCLDGRNSSEQM